MKGQVIRGGFRMLRWFQKVSFKEVCQPDVLFSQLHVENFQVAAVSSHRDFQS